MFVFTCLIPSISYVKISQTLVNICSHPYIYMARLQCCVYILNNTIGVINRNKKEQQRQVYSSLSSKEITDMLPIISKLYCCPSQTVLVVRKRPHAVNGGGLVVTDYSTQSVLFRVDGCGILGKKGEVVLRDGDGDALILMRQKQGLFEALSFYKKWKGYKSDYEGSLNLVFSLKESKSCLVKNSAIRISTQPRTISNKGWDFEISGYFPDKCCSIVDSNGNIVAKIEMKKELKKLMENKDLYHVVVKPGMDQAFVFGVIAILDYIYGESTNC